MRRSILALEVGDWFAVLTSATSPLTAEAAALVVALRMLADSMQSRAWGDVGRAWSRLSDVASILPRAMQRWDGDGRFTLAVMTPRQDTDVWLTSSLVWREQQELLDLRRRLSRNGIKPRDELVEAYIERLGCVDHQPWTWRHPKGNQLAVTPTREELLRRGTRLRKFVRPLSGDLSQSVWRDIGAYGGLHAAAMSRLAERPLPVPWDVASGVPVRLGCLRAWEHSRKWAADIDY